MLEFTSFVTYFVCFYVNYFFITPRLYDAKKLYKWVIAFILGVTCFVIVRFSLEEILLPATFGFRNYMEGTDFWFYFCDNIFYSSFPIFISTTFWFFKYSMDTEAEKTQLVEARRIAELQALKTQINPHFIFNSLNNIYSLVYQKSDKSLAAIEELSTLLRYSTKDLEKDFILPGKRNWIYRQPYCIGKAQNQKSGAAGR
ncbi:histidine kinase [Chryseobacterium camelliae]|uniref:Signal transduction histidine kinase internal region domain-containing protein n=1 Tax=Chryseobacterium camelliae TaxID=1265445 RepID=A0ABU0TLQ0_9FLAO|nr:sensor histidine kinase [Chryseobacterium camelliae]MDQ1097975.1 hypothetical protein [Chryseobacterium camelliae]